MKLDCEALESRTLLSRTGLADFAALAVDPQSHDPATILVRFRSGVTAPQPLPGSELEREFTLVPGLHSVRLQPGVSVAEALGAYRASPLVQYAEPNFFVGIQDTEPDDPEYPNQCNLHRIEAARAWDVWVGTFGTTVAVIDTGIDYTHLDLALNIWINQGEIPADRLANLTDLDGDGRITIWELNDPINQGPDRITDQNGDGWISAADLLAPQDGSLGGWANGVDDDGDSRADDLAGWNFYGDSRFPLDDNGHGSHVAGIIGAQGNNGYGVAGVNWYTQLMPLKFLSASGSGTLAAALRSLDYAVQHGARVSSNGWGGGGYSQAFFDALVAARDAGHIFVTAAGASGINLDERPQYPASYQVENVIVAATTDCQDRHASFTNWGINTVELSAPGINVHSTYRDGTFRTLSGTSMSQALVAGALTLMWDALPYLSYNDVILWMLATVDPLDPPCRTGTCGRLNLGRAMTGTSPGGAPDSGDGGSGFDSTILAALVREMERRDAFVFTTP